MYREPSTRLFLKSETFLFRVPNELATFCKEPRGKSLDIPLGRNGTLYREPYRDGVSNLSYEVNALLHLVVSGQQSAVQGRQSL